MPLDELRKSYVKYRLETAKENLDAAKLLYENNQLKGAANRAYYCVFHAMRTVLAIDNLDFKHHSAVIAYFRKEYIKTGILDKKLSNIIQTLSMVRNSSDYDDFYLISKEDAMIQVENASIFYSTVEAYVQSLLEDDNVKKD